MSYDGCRGAEAETDLSIKMPRVDVRLRELSNVTHRLAAMDHLRCINSHKPMDRLRIKGQAQHICVFRHPRDIHFSYLQHYRQDAAAKGL
ncbi:MAG: sulfotransferase domain-containing protein [Marinovum sp.]|nr:sulfotransferase domain-containing protein [Marinovum sp.]